eukprot:Lankesteria_metandrocarpae@DN8101_c0_g1_i1.p1
MADGPLPASCFLSREVLPDVILVSSHETIHRAHWMALCSRINFFRIYFDDLREEQKDQTDPSGRPMWKNWRIRVDASPVAVELLLDWLYHVRIEFPDPSARVLSEDSAVAGELSISGAEYVGAIGREWEVLRLAIMWKAVFLYESIVLWSLQVGLQHFNAANAFRLLGATFTFNDYQSAVLIIKALLELTEPLQREGVVNRLRQTCVDPLSLWSLRVILAVYKQPELSAEFLKYGTYTDLFEQFDFFQDADSDNDEVGDDDEPAIDGPSVLVTSRNDKNSTGGTGNGTKTKSNLKKERVVINSAKGMAYKEGGARGLLNVVRKRSDGSQSARSGGGGGDDEFSGLIAIQEDVDRQKDEIWRQQRRLLPVSKKPVFVEAPDPPRDLNLDNDKWLLNRLDLGTTAVSRNFDARDEANRDTTFSMGIMDDVTQHVTAKLASKVHLETLKEDIEAHARGGGTEENIPLTLPVPQQPQTTIYQEEVKTTLRHTLENTKIIHTDHTLEVWKGVYRMANDNDIQAVLKKLDDSVFSWFIPSLDIQEQLELLEWSRVYGSRGRLGAKVIAAFCAAVVLERVTDNNVVGPPPDIVTNVHMAVKIALALNSLTSIPKNKGEQAGRVFLSRSLQTFVCRDKKEHRVMYIR